MKLSKPISLSLLVWLAVSTFWLIITWSYHPTGGLSVIVTVSLMIAYAGATYVNHLWLIPRFWQTNRYAHYAILLCMIMAVFTGIALAIIRFSYLTLLGPDPDPNGIYIHYIIDFLGMVIHVFGAAGIVRLYNHFISSRM
jgi:hypothetical protein